jgi:glycerol kinase
VPYLLAFDEGTTSARTCLYSEALERVGMASRATVSRHPHPGWVEQDAGGIWRAQIESAHEVLASSEVGANELAAIGITNQRETIVVWEREGGRPVAPAIVWQCRRTADFCRELAARPVASTITAKTGLVIDAYFSATKLRWILDHIPDGQRRAESGDLLAGTIDTWLIWKLTNGQTHATDPTNASRTMLMNLATGEWDSELLSLFGIPLGMLPRIAASSGVIGVARAEHLGADIPITGNAGDQQAALFGQCCFQAGMAKNTYGTGCFALLHTGGELNLSSHRLLTTRAASTGAAAYALEGSVFVAGAVVQWMRDQMKLFAASHDTQAVAKSVASTQGVYFVPAFVGLGAPYWDSEARGTITGLTLGAGIAHIVRAGLESIAYQTRDLIEAMAADSGKPLVELRVDGGAARNDFLMQFQADVLGVRLVRPADTETTARGAASLAALGAGLVESESELSAAWRSERVFEPQMSQDQRDTLYAGWRRAVRQTLEP